MTRIISVPLSEKTRQHIARKYLAAQKVTALDAGDGLDCFRNCCNCCPRACCGLDENSAITMSIVGSSACSFLIGLEITLTYFNTFGTTTVWAGEVVTNGGGCSVNRIAGQLACTSETGFEFDSFFWDLAIYANVPPSNSTFCSSWEGGFGSNSANVVCNPFYVESFGSQFSNSDHPNCTECCIAFGSNVQVIFTV